MITIRALIIFFILFEVLENNIYCAIITEYSIEVSSPMPQILKSQTNSFRKSFCGTVCKKDASNGGTYCNCDNVNISRIEVYF
jgi:hypothetical protein